MARSRSSLIDEHRLGALTAQPALKNHDTPRTAIGTESQAENAGTTATGSLARLLGITPNVALTRPAFASVFDPDISRHRKPGKAAAAPGP